MPLTDEEITLAQSEGLSNDQVNLLGEQSYVALSAWRLGLADANQTLALNSVQAEALLSGISYEKALLFKYYSQARAFRTGKVTIDDALTEFTDDNELSTASAMALENSQIPSLTMAKTINSIFQAMALTKFTPEQVKFITNWAQGEAVALYGVSLEDSALWDGDNYKAMFKEHVYNPSLALPPVVHITTTPADDIPAVTPIEITDHEIELDTSPVIPVGTADYDNSVKKTSSNSKNKTKDKSKDK